MHLIAEDLEETWIHEGIERLQQFLDVRAAFNDFFNHYRTDDE